MATHDMNRCGDVPPSNTAVANYIFDAYLCGICRLYLMILDLVLLGHWYKLLSDIGSGKISSCSF